MKTLIVLFAIVVLYAVLWIFTTPILAAKLFAASRDEEDAGARGELQI